MARLVRVRRRRNLGGFGKKDEGGAAGAGAWGEVPGMSSFLVKCGTRVVGTAMSIQTHPESTVLACFDAVTQQAPSAGCRHFPSQAMARAWLRLNAKMVKC